jgi:hypothetical protein
MTTVKCSNFVKRQTPESRFSHYMGTWEGLEVIAETFYKVWEPGYKPGVFTVQVPPYLFKTSIVPIEGREVFTRLEARQEGEEPVCVRTVSGKKLPPLRVDLVIYSAAVLDEDNDRSTDADFEIISINASPTSEPVPMTPTAMARNQLHLTGGTKGNYTPEQFAKSIMFWETHAMVEG